MEKSKAPMSDLAYYFEQDVAALRKRMEDEKDDAFKLAMIQAIQTLGVLHHRNNRAALKLMEVVVGLYYDQKEFEAASLVFYVAGAIANDELCKSLLTALHSLSQPGA